jgi:cytosine/adenosine deaminase-related metal-dependent hydrolase
MAIYNNARLASHLLPGAPVGRLTPGSAADLIFVDYQPTTPLTADNLPWHILFGFRDSMVTTTIVGGRMLMHDRELLVLDEERVAARSRELAAETWERYQKHVPAD